MQDSSGTHNLPTHLPAHFGVHLVINLMFGEITLLQLCVDIDSGHSAILPCLKGLCI